MWVKPSGWFHGGRRENAHVARTKVMSPEADADGSLMTCSFRLGRV